MLGSRNDRLRGAFSTYRVGVASVVWFLVFTSFVNAAVAKDDFHTGGGSVPHDARRVLDDYAALRERVMAYEMAHRALREARQSGSIGYRPDYTRDLGCFLPPVDFDYEAMKLFVKDASSLLSMKGRVAVSVVIVTWEDWTERANCVGPRETAEARWRAMISESEDAINILEDALKSVRRDWTDIEPEFACLDAITVDPNRFEVERGAAKRLARQHYTYCMTHVVSTNVVPESPAGFRVN